MNPPRGTAPPASAVACWHQEGSRKRGGGAERSKRLPGSLNHRRNPLHGLPPTPSLDSIGEGALRQFTVRPGVAPCPLWASGSLLGSITGTWARQDGFSTPPPGACGPSGTGAGGARQVGKAWGPSQPDSPLDPQQRRFSPKAEAGSAQTSKGPHGWPGALMGVL